MNKPKTPKEDPAVTAAREREERRAEAARTADTQALLLGDTTRRFRRFGGLSGSSYAGTVAPASGGVAASGSSGLVSRLANQVFSGGSVAGRGSDVVLT